MIIKRDLIVKEAKSWLGTRFRYQGRIKKNENFKGGVDCLGLIIGVCDAVGYEYNGKPLSYYDNIVYSRKPNFEVLKEKFSKYFYLKKIENIEIGDIVLKKISKEQYHLMIYTGNSFIHASAVTLNVVEHFIDNFEDCIVYSMNLL